MQRANNDPSYFRRFLWVALGCLAYSGWCCYDALIAYPQKRVIAAAHDQLKAEIVDAGRDVSETSEAWRQLAKKQGWDLARPEKTAEEITHDIGKQYMMIILCALIGLPAFIKWARSQGTWVEGNEELIRNSKGQELKIADIVKIDKRKWEDKGIAHIHYQPVGERKKKFVMDDYKFEREPMALLMSFAEANLKPDQITGGKSQKQIQADKEAAAKKKAERRAQRQAEAAAKPPQS